MNLLQRIRLVSAADPFVPFTIRDSGGMAWPIEARECLTVLGGDATLLVMVRSGSDRRDWTHANIRVAELVSVAWAASASETDGWIAGGPTDASRGGEAHDDR
ncbi:MAG: hypothetical protein RJA16_624 [Planctomycetota bacterium]|jgi:hypothetical protein